MGLDRNAHVISWDSKGIHDGNSHSKVVHLRPPLIEISGGGEPDDFYIDDEEDEEIVDAEEKVVRNMLFKQVSAASRYTCGILYEDSSLYCWGKLPFSRTSPFVRQGPFLQVSASQKGLCVIHDNTHALECFGSQSGLVTPADDEYDQVSVGHSATCVITMDSAAKCFSIDPDMALVPIGLTIA